MKNPDFYRFLEPDDTLRDRPFDGMLSFLPQPEHVRSESRGIRHVAFDDGNIQWLEIKDTLTADKVRLELQADSPRYWLLFQLWGMSEVYLPHAIRQQAGWCYGFGTRRSKVPLALSGGNAWLLLVGCKSELLPALAREFVQLDGMQDLFDDDGPVDYLVTDQSIDYLQRRRLEELEKMEYRPFSTPIMLSEWLLRTLQHLFKPMPPADVRQVTLYREALQYIREHYLEDISKASIAKALNVSVRTLTRAFEGRSDKVNDHIHKLKLNKARELLYTTNRPVEEISRELNFSCPKYFTNRYRQRFFESPTQFRLQYTPTKK